MMMAAIRKSLLTWPRARLTGIEPELPSLFLVLRVRRPELGGQRRELGLEAAAGVGPGQAADLYGTGWPGRASPDEDSPAADHKRKQQPAQGRDAANQGGHLARVVGDGQADPRDVAGERDGALAVRQLQRLARQ